MFLPTHSKIKLLILCLGSLVFLIGGLRAGKSAGKREQRLSVLTGLAGLLYVGLELCWYFYVGFLQSRTITLAYYFAWRLCGGVVAGLFLHVILKSAKVLLAASAVLLVVFNVFVIARHLVWATSLVGMGNGLFGGMLIVSLVLLCFDRLNKQNQGGKTESTMPG
jgi:hypothetical protein